MTDGPVILLPTDERIVDALIRKRDEYFGRVALEDHGGWEYRAPEQKSHSVRYKLFVLDRLLETGSVATHDLCRELHARYGYVTDEFGKAAAVIDNYTKGKPVTGGTGLAL